MSAGPEIGELGTEIRSEANYKTRAFLFYDGRRPFSESRWLECIVGNRGVDVW
jgi:hypothetical protein